MTTIKKLKKGALAEQLAHTLKERILLNKYNVGGYLPSVRQLTEEFELADKTIQRALKMVEKNGLIASEPRKGYKVLARAGNPSKGYPIAFILSVEDEMQEWDSFHKTLYRAFQLATIEKGWSILNINIMDESSAEIADKLKSSGACAAILDSSSVELFDLVREAGMISITVDSWDEYILTDTVNQDNYRGGYLAAEYLLKKKHTKIAWFGNVAESSASRERFGGATSAVVSRCCSSIELPKELQVNAYDENPLEAARKYLAKPKHAKAVLALWAPMAQALMIAAKEKGLRLGKDIDIVGWCINEEVEDFFGKNIKKRPPLITWSGNQLAAIAINMLEERRDHPEAPPLRINIPVTLH